MRPRDWGSTPTVGSSRSTIGGSCTIAAARFNRRFIPPEYPRTRSPARSTRPTKRSAARTRARSPSPSRPWIEAKNSRFSRPVSDVVEGEGLGRDAESAPGLRRRGRTDPFDLDPAFVGLEEPGHEPDRRRLSRSVRPQQAEDLAAAHLEAQAVHRHDPPVALAHPVDDEGVHSSRRGVSAPGSPICDARRWRRRSPSVSAAVAGGPQRFPCMRSHCQRTR